MKKTTFNKKEASGVLVTLFSTDLLACSRVVAKKKRQTLHGFRRDVVTVE